MKAFKVFWKGNINENEPRPAPYIGSAIIVASSFGEAMKIAESYGEISALHSESDVVVTELKQSGPGFSPNPVGDMVAASRES